MPRLVVLFALALVGCFNDGSATTPDAGCSGGLDLCGSVCVDLQSDVANCGSCGHACADGQVCSGGMCALTCESGRVACDGTCIDPDTDRDHCGASGDCQGANAGEACDANEVCSGGSCVLTCESGQVACNGTCIDPDTDATYCGATGDCTGANAGETCDANEVCSGGTCQLSCDSGQIACGGACIDPDSDPTYCGAMGDCTGANAGETCDASEVCSGGTCQLSCDPGLLACNGACIDPDTNNTYCGATGDCMGANAGTTCGMGEVCTGGVCQLSCDPGLIACGGACIDPDTNNTYCGATGDCMGANAGTTCAANQSCIQGVCTTIYPFDMVAFPIAVPGSTYGLGQFVLGFDDDLFVAGAGSLDVYRIDSQTGAVTEFASNIIASGYVLSLAYDAGAGALYVGAENSQLIKLDSTGTPTSLGTVPGQINTLEFAPAGFGAFGGQLIAGTTLGLYAIDTTATPATVTPISTTVGNISDVEFVGTTLYVVTQALVRTVSSAGTATTLTSIANSRLDGIVYDPKRDVFYIADSEADVLWTMTPAGATTNLASYNFDDGFFISGLLMPSPDRLLIGTGESSLTIEALALP